MATVVQKTVVTQKLEGKCVSHSRTEVAALVGCMNVITHKVAHRLGVHIKSMNVRAEAQFDRRGVAMFCPLAKVLRAAGTELRAVWSLKR